MSASTADTGVEAAVRVELVVGHPGECPVAAASEACDGTARSVTRCCGCRGGDAVIEFTVTGRDQPSGFELEEVFSTETATRYRDSRSRCQHCAVWIPEQYDCPVTDVRAEHGDLYLTFHADDLDRVRSIVETAREQYDSVTVAQLTLSTDAGDPETGGIGENRLTDRQREVLATAHEMGYFEYPKGANAGEVAAALDISPSTLAEHLAAAQQKLVGPVVAGQSPEMG